MEINLKLRSVIKGIPRVTQIYKMFKGLLEKLINIYTKLVSFLKLFWKNIILWRGSKKVAYDYVECDSSTCLFVFFGHDIPRLTSLKSMVCGKSIWHFMAKGFVFLPLNSEALFFVKQNSMGYVLEEDILSEKERAESIEIAKMRWAELLEECKKEATVHGIHWLHQDIGSFYWSWEYAFCMESLAKKLICKNIKLVSFVEQYPLRPGYRLRASDLTGHILKSNLKEKVQPVLFTVSDTKATSINTYISSGLEDDFPTLPLDETQQKAMKNAAWLVIMAEEMYRFQPVAKLLNKTYQNQLVVVLIGASLSTTQYWQTQLGIPVLSMPLPVPDRQAKIFDGLHKKLIRLTSAWTTWGSGAEWHIAAFTYDRWPRLVKWFEAWQHLVAELSPLCVGGSDYYYLDAELAILAAKEHKIPTYYFPHGKNSVPCVSAPDYVADVAFCGCDLQAEIIGRYEPDVVTVVTDDLKMEEEYEMHSPFTTNNNDHAPIVLGLMGPIIAAEASLPNCGTKASIDLVQAFFDASKPARHCSVYLKNHPWGYDNQLMQKFFPRMKKSILPTQTNLHAVLKKTNICVMLNYYGPPAIHAMEKNIPVIFAINSLLTEKAFDVCVDYPYALYHSNGLLVRNHENVWDIINELLTNEDLYSDIVQKQQLFLKSYNEANNTSVHQYVINRYQPVSRAN